MREVEECISKYQNLLKLLEEECGTISQGLQGKLLDDYLKLLHREVEMLEEGLDSLQVIY